MVAARVFLDRGLGDFLGAWQALGTRVFTLSRV